MKQGTGHIPKHLVQFVAFTPKGGCPLKLPARGVENTKLISSSIHPQGWVPIETMSRTISADSTNKVAFTPKGGCPLKLDTVCQWRTGTVFVAFTPKGGCPLKRSVPCPVPNHPCFVAFTPKGGCPLKLDCHFVLALSECCSIHPQGWVPIETVSLMLPEVSMTTASSIHPQGWVPIETGGGLDKRGYHTS